MCVYVCAYYSALSVCVIWQLKLLLALHVCLCVYVCLYALRLCLCAYTFVHIRRNVCNIAVYKNVFLTRSMQFEVVDMMLLPHKLGFFTIENHHEAPKNMKAM